MWGQQPPAVQERTGHEKYPRSTGGIQGKWTNGFSMRIPAIICCAFRSSVRTRTVLPGTTQNGYFSQTYG